MNGLGEPRPQPSTSAPAALAKLPRVVFWLGVVSLLTDVGTELIYPLLPLFLSNVLHARREFIGAVEGAAETTAALLKLVSGKLADRAARKKPLTVFGYGVSSLVRPLVGLATAPWHVLLTRVADRVGKGVRSSPRDALLADATVPSQRGRAYGFHQAMDNAGAILGPLAATALLAAGVGLRPLFLLAAIPGALAMAALLFGVREPERPSDSALMASRAPASAATVAARSSLARYLVAVALFGLGNSSDAFLLLRAQQLGVAVKWIPSLWMAHNATKAALSTWGGALSDRVGRRRVIIAGWALYALTYLLFGLASTAWHAWALFVVYGVYYALTEGTQRALVADLAPGWARGTAFGWYNATVGVVALPASLAFGALADRWGARLPFTASALLAAAASLWLALLVHPPSVRSA
jgi:MFS family permease